MSIEGLQALLTKEAIVATEAVDRLSQSPQAVEVAYLHHVRSYVPMGRAAEGEEGTLTVAEFERRLIRLVKEGKAPTGYVTAEYGYGKTSTCLYLWQQCREANLVAVPPFEFTQLSQLMSATHAWVRYELSRVRPDLVPLADSIRGKYETRSLDELAEQKGMPIEVLRELYADGQLMLTWAPIRYVQFFEEITDLVLQAGFDGLVILPDELQQYLDPLIKSGMTDPVVPLFDIVQGMITRRGTLRCGLLFSVPARTLSKLNEDRGDFVQRLKSQGLGFDLRNVYTADFALQLWQRLSEQFDFVPERDALVEQETLRAIGEIAARPDLASGPRTVIAVFQRMVDRYIHPRAEVPHPYTPIDLIDDYLAGAIPFDETGKIRQVVNARLSASIVANNAEHERLVRLVAAYPTEGCPHSLVERMGLIRAYDELAAAGQGDLIIFLGSVSSPGMTLRGLEPQNEGPTDWLHATLRDFNRNYVDSADITMRRALASFERLLLDRTFPNSTWTKIAAFEKRMTQNQGLLLEGSFAGAIKLYPKRRMYIRLLREGEQPVAFSDTDFSVDFILRPHLDQPLEQRGQIAGTIENADPHRLRLELNLSHRSATTYHDLQSVLQPVANPYKVCPLLLLALDEYIEEKRRANQIPRAEDDFTKNTFQQSLADYCVSELFNTDLKGPQGETGTKLMESLFLDACQQLFPRYKTLMVNNQWTSALQNDYRRALESLSSSLERQGEVPVEGTKTDIAKRLGRTNTAFDSFVSSFPTLIRIEQPFRGDSQGAVMFTLHPLEHLLLSSLKNSQQRVKVSSLGASSTSLQSLSRADFDALASQEGYRDLEIDEILAIMQARGLILLDPKSKAIALAPRRTPSINELNEAVRVLQAQLAPLVSYYESETLTRQKQQLDTIAAELPKLRRNPEEARVAQIYRALRSGEQQIAAFIADKRTVLQAEIQQLILPQPTTSQNLNLLQSAVSTEFFGKHLERIRQDVLSSYAQYDATCNEVTAKLQDLRCAIMTDLDADNLVSVAKQLRAIQEQGKNLLSTKHNLDGLFFPLIQATNLLSDVVGLDKRLAQQNPVLLPCKQELDAFIRDVSEALATRRQGSLRDISVWENQLAQVKQCIAEVEHSQQQEFEQWQNRYRVLLETHLHLSQNDLPRTQTYINSNPQESRDRFANEVKQTVIRQLEALLSECRRVTDRLGAISYSGDLATLPSPQGEVAADRAEQCQELIGIVYQQALELNTQAGESDGKLYAEPSGEFDGFCQALSEAQTKARRMADLLRQVEGALQQERLTDLEQVLLSVIQKQATRNGHAVDLGTILQSSGQPTTALLSLLENLYKKRRISILLNPVIHS